MKHKTRIFYNFEATSVAIDADAISVGLVAVTTIDGEQEIKTFYAEFTNFNTDKCADWVKENVINKLQYSKLEEFLLSEKVYSNTENISKKLKQWLSQFEEIEFWADYDNRDRSYLQHLIGDWSNYMISGVPEYPSNIKYDQFFDLHTVFKIKGIDTDIDREEFALIDEYNVRINLKGFGTKHNALYDAYIAYLCYCKLDKLKK